LCGLRFELCTSYFNKSTLTTTLHNILCFCITFNIFVLGFATAQLRSRSAEPRPVVLIPGRLRHSLSRPQPASSLPHHGPSRPQPPTPRSGKPRPAAASHATTPVSCAPAAPWLHQGRGWPLAAATGPWLAVPYYPSYTKVVACSSDKMVIPLFTKITCQLYL
jgi:hypothetical protein